MKRLIFALGAALIVSTLGPLPTVSARDWWWHHSKTSPAGVGANRQIKRTKAQREKQSHGKLEALYTSPKSIGWWHKGPGPIGAGAGAGGKQDTKTEHRDKQHKGRSARASNGHSHFAWLHHHHDSAPDSAASGGGSK